MNSGGNGRLVTARNNMILGMLLGRPWRCRVKQEIGKSVSVDKVRARVRVLVQQKASMFWCVE